MQTGHAPPMFAEYFGRSGQTEESVLVQNSSIHLLKNNVGSQQTAPGNISNKLSHSRESGRSMKVNKDTRRYDLQSQRQDALTVTSPYREWTEVERVPGPDRK